MIDLLLWSSAALAAAPLLVVAGLCVAASLPGRRPPLPGDALRPPLAVLIPAHNEEREIGRTLDALRPQIQPGDRLLVVADRCTDRTLALARAHGAETIEHSDPARRGKGYALDCGVRRLALDPPRAVVMIDADCEAHPGSVERLARAALARGRPVQGAFLVDAPDHSTAQDRALSVLAYRVRNLIRPLGWHRLGLPCLLNGSGMAFPWEVLAQLPLAGPSIVEDRQYAVDLALRGLAPTFCPDATLSSALPTTEAAARAQRARWEHGQLETILQLCPRLLAAALRRRSLSLLALTIELAVPPLALAGLFSAGVLLLACIAAGGWGASWGPAIGVFVTWATTGLALGLALTRLGSPVPLRALLRAPGYALAKASLYRDFLHRRQRHWVRTDRGSGPGEGKP